MMYSCFATSTCCFEFTVCQIYFLSNDSFTISFFKCFVVLNFEQTINQLLTLLFYNFLLHSMWGTLLADIVIQMLGTDYARIVQAIYAFAQVSF